MKATLDLRNTSVTAFFARKRGKAEDYTLTFASGSILKVCMKSGVTATCAPRFMLKHPS